MNAAHKFRLSCDLVEEHLILKKKIKCSYEYSYNLKKHFIPENKNSNKPRMFAINDINIQADIDRCISSVIGGRYKSEDIVIPERKINYSFCIDLESSLDTTKTTGVNVKFEFKPEKVRSLSGSYTSQNRFLIAFKPPIFVGEKGNFLQDYCLSYIYEDMTYSRIIYQGKLLLFASINEPVVCNPFSELKFQILGLILPSVLRMRVRFCVQVINCAGFSEVEATDIYCSNSFLQFPGSASDLTTTQVTDSSINLKWKIPSRLPTKRTLYPVSFRAIICFERVEYDENNLPVRKQFQLESDNGSGCIPGLKSEESVHSIYVVYEFVYGDQVTRSVMSNKLPVVRTRFKEITRKQALKCEITRLRKLTLKRTDSLLLNNFPQNFHRKDLIIKLSQEYKILDDKRLDNKKEESNESTPHLSIGSYQARELSVPDFVHKKNSFHAAGTKTVITLLSARKCFSSWKIFSLRTKVFKRMVLTFKYQQKRLFIRCWHNYVLSCDCNGKGTYLLSEVLQETRSIISLSERLLHNDFSSEAQILFLFRQGKLGESFAFLLKSISKSSALKKYQEVMKLLLLQKELFGRGKKLTSRKLIYDIKRCFKLLNKSDQAYFRTRIVHLMKHRSRILTQTVKNNKNKPFIQYYPIISVFHLNMSTSKQNIENSLKIVSKKIKYMQELISGLDSDISQLQAIRNHTKVIDIDINYLTTRLKGVTIPPYIKSNLPRLTKRRAKWIALLKNAEFIQDEYQLQLEYFEKELNNKCSTTYSSKRVLLVHGSNFGSTSYIAMILQERELLVYHVTCFDIVCSLEFAKAENFGVVRHILIENTSIFLATDRSELLVFKRIGKTAEFFKRLRFFKSNIQILSKWSLRHLLACCKNIVYTVSVENARLLFKIDLRIGVITALRTNICKGLNIFGSLSGRLKFCNLHDAIRESYVVRLSEYKKLKSNLDIDKELINLDVSNKLSSEAKDQQQQHLVDKSELKSLLYELKELAKHEKISLNSDVMEVFYEHLCCITKIEVHRDSKRILFLDSSFTLSMWKETQLQKVVNLRSEFGLKQEENISQAYFFVGFTIIVRTQSKELLIFQDDSNVVAYSRKYEDVILHCLLDSDEVILLFPNGFLKLDLGQYRKPASLEDIGIYTVLSDEY